MAGDDQAKSRCPGAVDGINCGGPPRTTLITRALSAVTWDGPRLPHHDPRKSVQIERLCLSVGLFTALVRVG